MGVITGAARDHLTLHGQMRRSKKINASGWVIDALPMSAIGPVRDLRVDHAFSPGLFGLKLELITASPVAAKIKLSPQGHALPNANSTFSNDCLPCYSIGTWAVFRP